MWTALWWPELWSEHVQLKLLCCVVHMPAVLGSEGTLMGNGSVLSLQQGAQQPPLSRPLSRDKVRDNPPYRAPLSRDKARDNPPYRAPLSRDKVRDNPPYRAPLSRDKGALTPLSAPLGAPLLLCFQLAP